MLVKRFFVLFFLKISTLSCCYGLTWCPELVAIKPYSGRKETLGAFVCKEPGVASDPEKIKRREKGPSKRAPC